MIRNSFVFLDRIGLARERAIWQSNVNDWDCFLGASRVKGIGKCKPFYDRQILRAKRHLNEDDSFFFSGIFPVSEHWRLYERFRDDVVFIDIETSGLSVNDTVTVVGLYDGSDTKTMVRGINLDFKRLGEELSRYRMIVTFNGSSFDIPFIRRFTGVPGVPHFDLRFGCRRIGLSGGLKAIEREVGIKRKNEFVAGMNGGDAAELWRLYKATGDRYYLDLLVEYNEEDVINLRQLADFAYSKLKERALNF
ncbi:ribonuclease H-like domain-containing protein [Candidatus Woesearchaeota archaeon]|nr:ribonuclease H-like domain-containing protein [Candidatus Woesearchaeota archaeon]